MQNAKHLSDVIKCCESCSLSGCYVNLSVSVAGIELFHVTSHVQIMTWHKTAAILVHIENVWAKIETS